MSPNRLWNALFHMEMNESKSLIYSGQINNTINIKMRIEQAARLK